MAKKPKIRFNGFQEDWQETSFRSMASLRRGLTYSPDNIRTDGETVKVLRSSNINVDRFVQKDDDVFVTKDCVNISLAKEGDILITAANGSTNLVGKHAIIKGLKTDAVHGGFMLLAESKEPQFTNASMSSAWYNRFIKLFVAGGNGAIGNLNKNDLDEARFLAPESKDERDVIGNFFDTLDDIISLRERELEKLKQLKAACLDKMFANGGGKSRPSIRFAGFTDEWREEIARLIFQTVCEKNHPELPVLSATQDKGMVIRDDKVKKVIHDVSNEVTYKRVCPGQFVIHLRSFQGGFAHSNVEGITSPAYTIMDFIDKSKHDDYFWKYIFMSKQFIKRLETVTYGIRDGRSISYEDFTGLGFVFPEQVEQTKIAEMISLMDKTTSLRQAELTKLRNLKQACLAQMFAAA